MGKKFLIKPIKLKDIQHLPDKIGIRKSDSPLLLCHGGIGSIVGWASSPSEKDKLIKEFHPKIGDKLLFAWHRKWRVNEDTYWCVASCAFHGNMETVIIQLTKKDLEGHL